MEKKPSTTGKAHESRKWGLPGFPVVLMESLISYLPTLMLCLHARERYKNSSLYSITSTVAPHAEYNKNHILVSIDLSLKAQNQNFRKTTPNPRGSHQGKAASGRKALSESKTTNIPPQQNPVPWMHHFEKTFHKFFRLFWQFSSLSFSWRLGKKNWVLLPLKGS